MTTETIKITFGGESVLMTWDGAEQSAPIKVDGAHINRQTADARHRTAAAVALAAAHVWPESEWPTVGAGGELTEATEAWDELEYEAISAEGILAAAGVGLERRSDDAAPVSDRALPIETCRDLVRQIRAAGLEASWAPDNDDRSVGWIYC